MSDLSKALAAVGESAPERPDYLFGSLPTTDYTVAIESLALRLAVRLAESERLLRETRMYALGSDCTTQLLIERVDEHLRKSACHGTGKEQPR